jgi:hypothetical protein
MLEEIKTAVYVYDDNPEQEPEQKPEQEPKTEAKLSKKERKAAKKLVEEQEKEEKRRKAREEAQFKQSKARPKSPKKPKGYKTLEDHHQTGLYSRKVNFPVAKCKLHNCYLDYWDIKCRRCVMKPCKFFEWCDNKFLDSPSSLNENKDENKNKL